MPDLYLIAGCNGAGKTTAATVLLPEVLGIRHFVNADQIAAELSPENPEAVAIPSRRGALYSGAWTNSWTNAPILPSKPPSPPAAMPGW